MHKLSLIESVIRHFESVGFDELSDLLYSNVILDEETSSVEDYIPNDEDLCLIAQKARASYVGSGVSKAVFSIQEDDSVVIKIPMLGMKAYRGYPEDFDEWDNGYELMTFDGILKRGKVESERCDYCQREVELYSMAVEAGLGKLFAKTEYLCTLYESIPLYASERCVTDVYKFLPSHRSFTDEELDLVENSGLNRFGVETPVEVLMARKYGYDTVYRLYDFCSENGINDLHSGNWGITKDGDLKIIDFSGFFE